MCYNVMNGRHVSVAAVVLLLITCSAWADNQAAVADMANVIQADTRLSDARKQVLCDIVADQLLTQPDLGQDKQTYAGEHLRVYLNELLEGTESYDDSQFAVVAATLQWNLGNYVRLPSISEEDRANLNQRWSTCTSAIATFVNNTYADTPEEVRKELILRVNRNLENAGSTLGNYFYPQTVYPSKGDVSSADVLAQFATYPFTGDNEKKFAPVDAIIADPDITQESKAARIDAFLFQESFRLKNAVGRAMRAYCDLGKAVQEGAYMPPPADLQAAYKTLLEQLQAAAKKEIADLPVKHARQAHEAFINNLLEGTGYSVENGVVQPPDEMSPSFMDPATHINTPTSGADTVETTEERPAATAKHKDNAAATSQSPKQWWFIGGIIIGAACILSGIVSILKWRRGRVVMHVNR